MPTPITPLPVAALTEATTSGNGVFDVLMTAMKAHLEQEYAKQRIRGPEYATVYLGALESVMRTAVEFLLQKDKAALEAQLVAAQIEKVMAEIKLTQAQTCLAKAQYDVAVLTKEKTQAETNLLQQKTATERAQTLESGVDANSVIGKQRLLFQAQTDGFTRDAEQKAAQILVDSWKIRRTTDEGTVADQTNKLDDATIGRAVSTLLAGVNA